jgi:PKD repeat protein
MKRIALFLVALLPLIANAQCVECESDVTCVSQDNFPTICPETLPEGTAGTYYETVLTFFMPATVVDPDSGVEATLNQIVIASVTGLPFGMTWTTNSPNNTYFPSQGETLGCATLCGTPILAGDYEVLITVSVTVTAFGFEQSLVQGFSLPLTILAGAGGNASFSFDNLSGCGAVTSTFEALIDGSPAITTYAWDFGNGSTSDQANPPSQTYTQAGEYVVTLTTTIENYVLNTVSLTDPNDGWCGDIEEPFCNCGTPFIGTCPDPYFTLTDGNGVVVYSSSEGADVTSVNWNNLNVALITPPYTLTFWDADLLSNADNLGSTELNLQLGNQSINANGSIGNYSMSLVISNQFVNEEVVSVFPFPTAAYTYLEDENVLDYDDETLEFFVWYYNGGVVQEGAQDSLVLAGPGIYQCEIFNIYGCSSWSDEFVLCPVVELTYDAEQQTISTTEGFASYNWFYNGLPLNNASSNEINAADLGNYSVTITTDYGCTVSSEVLTVTVGIEEGTRLTGVNAWPNPANDRLHVELPEGLWEVFVYDLSGRLISSLSNAVGQQTFMLDVAHLPVGSYLLNLRQAGQMKHTRFVIAR